eukprot:TRINITY_DN11752_c0_g1_i1.p1 TRINITY_DN11752_c0_g1~~TRINITY_DN11752_c0_g1_i1.p1  ORF type:complete len:592 (-),score=149.52 TRINITY_DN11752_c0_g1_i1:247-2022(-)
MAFASRSQSALRRSAPLISSGKVEFDSDDEIDVDKIFSEFANPFSDPARPKTAMSRIDVSAHRAERAHTLAYLRNVQKRSKESLKKIEEARKKLNEQQTAMNTFHSARDVVHFTKERARKNLYAHLRDLSSAEFKEKMIAHSDQLAQEHDAKLTIAQRETEEVIFQKKQADSQLVEAKEEIESLKHVVTLLRQKLHLVTEREIENQRRLKVFKKMEPIFEELSRSFDFQTPGEVIKRLQSLEESKMDGFTHLADVEEQRNAAERQLEAVVKKYEADKQMAHVQFQQDLQRSETRNEDLQNQLTSVSRQLDKAKEMEEKYLRLWDSVVDLWNKWSQSELVDTTAKRELPEMSNPLQVLQSINQLFTLHAPTKAAGRLRDMSGLANTFWMKYFNDKPEMKAQPKVIFEEIATQYEMQLLLNDKQERALTTEQIRTRELQIELEKSERRVRALQQELDVRQRAVAKKFDRPKSASVLNQLQMHNMSALDDLRRDSENVSVLVSVAGDIDGTDEFYDVGPIAADRPTSIDPSTVPPAATAAAAVYAATAATLQAPRGPSPLVTRPMSVPAAAPRPISVPPRLWQQRVTSRPASRG